MKILILEDDSTRHAKFEEILEGHEVCIVDTAEAAINKLNCYGDDWDWLFLDHDLGGEIYVESGIGTGYQVACWLEEHKDKMPKRGVALHSLNSVGRKNMQAALPDAWDMPGLWLIGRDDMEQFINGSCFSPNDIYL